MTTAELRDAIRTQDPLQVSHRETRTTDIDAWLRNLATDEAGGDIIDPIVYLSVTSHLACINDVLGKRVIGGDREAEQYRRRNVEASYVRHDTIQKVSVYCGVVCIVPNPTGNALEASKRTGEAVTTALRKIQTGLSRHPGLQVRSGLALHLHSITEAWSAGPEDAIEAPTTLQCATCGEDIYWANQQWRHASDGRAEAFDTLLGRLPGTRLPRRKLNHLADPEQEGRTL